jgi:hypothetical protein
MISTPSSPTKAAAQRRAPTPFRSARPGLQVVRGVALVGSSLLFLAGLRILPVAGDDRKQGRGLEGAGARPHDDQHAEQPHEGGGPAPARSTATTRPRRP